MDGKLYKSIIAINKMLVLPSFEDDQQMFIVKGKIIKSRSQILLAKNYCISEGHDEKEKASDEAEAITLIDDAIDNLTNIL